MKLIRLSLHNFRLLSNASIRLDGAQSTTILVGPNNSGKTSVAEALMLFAGGAGKHFSIYDFSIACRKEFEKEQALILAADADPTEILGLPIMSMDMHFEYSDDTADLAIAADLFMDVEEEIKRVTLRIEYAPNDPLKLAHDYREEREQNESLFEFLSAHLSEYYALSLFKVALDSDEKERLEDRKILARLIRIDFVFAQRHIDDQEDSRATRLSHLLHAHYEKHYRIAEQENHEEIERTLKAHADDLGGRYMKAFSGLIANLKQFGYPQRRAPSMSVRAELNSTTLFRDNTRIYYGTPSEASLTDSLEEEPTTARALSHELPEKYNGLGFKNLIYMILQIQSFRIALEQLPKDRPRVHLIFIEERETHLHPQVQSIFIRQISTFLHKDGAGEDVQVILTTHSSHIVADCGFSPIRYFRLKGSHVDVKDLLEFEHQVNAPDAIRFLSKYMSLMRCDLFFADKVILIEGQVERLLLPKMIAECTRNGHSGFASEYISLMEVGGAHAHIFEHLLKFIAIPTLIITDLDAVGTDGKSCCVASGVKTSNPTLKSWLPRKSRLENLSAASAAEKTDGCIRVMYQLSESPALPCGRTCEEAFIYRNADWLLANRASLLATGDRFDKDSCEVLVNDAYEMQLPKADFALDLMLIDGWATPRYIAEGLEWLATCEAPQ